MPELPEVETLKLGLEKYVVGHKILDIEVRKPKIFQGDKRDVAGAKITGVRRIGKGLIIELDKQYVLAVHLKMTGQLVYQGPETKDIILSRKTGGDLPSKWTHVIFTLDKNAKLFYNDLRQFGWIKVVKKDEVFDMAFFREMGPEPFVGQKSSLGQLPFVGQKSSLGQLPFVGQKSSLGFRSSTLRQSSGSSTSPSEFLTLALFKEVVQKGNLPIKVILMDQKKIGGIGNIYANEALFKAGIDPRRKGKSLSEEEIEKLFKSIIIVLEQGLKFGGSSDENFINVLGQEGAYQQHFLVYNRKGQKCPQCGGIIKKITLGSRGTYYCETCQK
jgi:formamidopyrimidine-DNA glycosylase